MKLLRVFKIVVESNGLAAAEETLAIGRSTISKHVSDLEIRMDMKLCERGRAGFKVTPYGKIVYEGIIELFDSLDQFRSKVTVQKNLLIGSVSLWVMDNTHLELGNPVARAITTYKDRPGSVELKMNTTDPESVEEAIRIRHANIGITISNNSLPGLVYQKIGVESTSLYCTNQSLIHGKSESEIVQNDLMNQVDFVLPAYLRDGPVLKRFHKDSNGVALHVDAKLQLILSGHYVGILPDHVAAPWVVKGDLFKIDYHEAEGENTLFVVYRSDNNNIATVAALIEDIQQSYLLSYND